MKTPITRPLRSPSSATVAEPRLAGEHEHPTSDVGPARSLEMAERFGHDLETPTPSASNRFEAATHGPGSSLPFRRRMEQAFGQDLSGVRAYLGQPEPAASLDAVAATDGQRVLFQDAQPHPLVVAHEVAHVVQRRRSGSAASSRGPLSMPGSAAETEAQSVSPLAAAGMPVRPQASAGPGLHRLDQKEFLNLISKSKVPLKSALAYYKQNSAQIAAIQENDNQATQNLLQQFIQAHPPPPKAQAKAPQFPKKEVQPSKEDLLLEAKKQKAAIAHKQDVEHFNQGPDVKKLPVERQQQLDLLQNIPKMTRSQFYQQVSQKAASGKGGLEAYAHQRYGKERGAEVHSHLSKMGKGFDQLLADPGLSSASHLDAFSQFVQKQRTLKNEDIDDPWKARDAYSDSLKKVTVYRGLHLPSEQIAQDIQKNGMTSRLTRSVESRLKNKEPLPDMSEMDNKPMSDVMLHHVHPIYRTGGRVSPLRKHLAQHHPKDLEDNSKAPDNFVDDEDFPQSISAHEGASASIAAVKLKKVADESEQAKKKGDVYTYKLHMSPLDLIAQKDYLPPDSKEAFPDHYEMQDPQQKGVQKLDMDDALESLVMPMIYPHEIQGVKKWAPEQIPSIQPVYKGLLESTGYDKKPISKSLEPSEPQQQLQEPPKPDELPSMLMSQQRIDDDSSKRRNMKWN